VIRAALAIFISAVTAGAQPRVEPPPPVLVFDRTTGSVDTVAGVLGGWFRTGSVLAGLDRVSFSADGRHAVLIRGAHVSRLDSVPQVRETALFESDGPIFLLRQQGAEVLLLTPTSIYQVPHSGEWRQLPAPPVPVTGLVICGDTVVFSAAGGVFRRTGGGAPEALLEGGEWLIEGSGETVFAADRLSGQIVRLADIGGAWTRTALVPPTAGQDAVTVAAVAFDAGQLFVAYNSRLLRAYDAADGRQGDEWTLDSQPSAFEPWGGRYWLLNPDRSGAEPMQVFDRLSRTPGFLPARELP
jgi:hypothetical protein